MKSHDEIKKGLECCRNLWDCKNKDCPYLGDGCYPKLHEDFKARMEQLEAERDAAVADMHEAQSCLCLICKNHKPDPEKKKYICKAFGDYPFEDGPLICRQFGWRGVQKEE